MRLEGSQDFILIIDEIQKVVNWSEAVKKEWDADTFNDVNIKVLLLGSSRILLEKGLSDSLMGRFELIKMSHWNYSEMRDAFGFTLEQFIYFGSYPGAAFLIQDEERWRDYIHSSIIDATIHKDILQDAPIRKPALLRQTFELGASYSAKIISLTKIIGQLQDAGNTTTLIDYLNLLSDSGLLVGLQKYDFDRARRRASIPKFQVYNNALKTVFSDYDYQTALADRKYWGHIYESAIGAFLVSQSFVNNYSVYYWRDGDKEVDYILKQNDKIICIEVKSNLKSNNAGLEEIRRHYNPFATFIVGDAGIKAEDFLSIDPKLLFKK